MWRGADSYTFQARVVPFLATLVPPIVLLATGVVTGAQLGTAGGVVGAVLAAVAAQVGRDRGRRLQPGLWKEWGGSPTLHRLRFAGHAYPDRIARLHDRIEGILGDPMPTAHEEADDPELAADRYDDAIERLRARTRRQDGGFGLLFAENVSYGQRRNLLGLRPVGIGVGFLTLVASALLLGLSGGGAGDRIDRFLPSVVSSAIMLGFWLFVVKRSWVRTPADAYADQLVAAVEQLGADARNPPR